MMALAWTVPQLVVLRFVQGLLLPPIFTVAVAYVGDEWPPADVARVAGLFVAGSSVGGFCGRFVTGVVADLLGWRASFAAVALITLAGAIIVTIALPRERQFRPLRRLCRFRQANDRASAQSAPPCDLRGRVRRLVQLHRHLHVCELSPGRGRPISSRRRCWAPCSPPILPEVSRCLGSAVPSCCSAAAASCLASSRCGSAAPSCCWRRRCPRSSSG